MLLQQDRWPEPSELVLCTVTKVLPHSVFVSLDEFGKSGLIHISEISPGRIRNIRDYVKEGKVVVCKVLDVREDRGHIDLSLRRVSDNQRRKKVNELKQEQKAEKIVEFVCGQLKKEFLPTYKEIMAGLKTHGERLYPFFQDIILDKAKVADLGLDKTITKALDDIVRQRIKPPEVSIEGTFKIITYASDGVLLIRSTFEQVLKDTEAEVYYEGGGRYHLRVNAQHYKDAEKSLKELTDTITEQASAYGTAVFERAA